MNETIIGKEINGLKVGEPVYRDYVYDAEIYSCTDILCKEVVYLSYEEIMNYSIK